MKFNLTKKVICNQTSFDISYILKAKNEILNFYALTEKDISHKNSVIRAKLTFVDFANNLISNKIAIKTSFIDDCFEINQDKSPKSCQEKCLNFCNTYGINYNFNKDNFRNLKIGLDLLLLILHIDKKIHLSFFYNIPVTIVKDKKRMDIGINVYPSLFKSLRLLDDNSEKDSQFLNESERENLLWYGMKMMIGLAWIDWHEANIPQLLAFKEEARKLKIGGHDNPLPYPTIISYLNLVYDNKFPINLQDWKDNAGLNMSKIAMQDKLEDILAKYYFTDTSNFKEIKDLPLKSINPSHFYINNLPHLEKILPDYKYSVQLWSQIEASYLSKRSLETYKSLNVALGYFNIYLFLILPLWYKNNTSQITYPKEPKDLRAGIFISTLITMGVSQPPSFIDFMDNMQEIRNVQNESIYAVLKNLEKFFSFIETYSSELPGSQGFKQPMSFLDFPKITRSMGSTKGLIPKSIFGFLIKYVEVISKYNKDIFDKVIDGKINATFFKEIENCQNQYIDTVKLKHIIGYIPTIDWNDKKIVLNELPNFLDFHKVKLKDSQILELPHPHIINHILVSLQTGLRNNHIQWLDAQKFDSLVREDDNNNFLPLYVNTDKSKNHAWTPMVSRAVIDKLKEQLHWRNLISNPSFDEKKFYNDNNKTKWEKFYPLFSYKANGLPYPDSGYASAWDAILCHVQNLLPLAGIKKIELIRLLPPNINFTDINIEDKLKKYGANCGNELCKLRYTSNITPHSARLSVVSHYITALPADMIGKYITGQTEAVVHHYVKLDPEYMTQIENGQREGLAKLAIAQQFNQLTGIEKAHPIFADSETSHLVKSLKMNAKETISSYGCISLSFNEELKTGVDMLIENSNIQMAFNKTEICPYNNQCPSNLIKELKGFRRCGICPYAVRSIDHLPAIAVKKRQVMELLEEIELKLVECANNPKNYSAEELDKMEDERQRITEELLGWILSEEMLESNRKNIVNNNSQPVYIVKKPEILIANLEQVSKKEGDIEYLLTRLADCESFPALDTPLIKAKFDLLRRRLLAQLGDFKAAFDMNVPNDRAQECLGLIREVIKRHNLTQEQTITLLTQDSPSLENKSIPLLEINHEK